MRVQNLTAQHMLQALKRLDELVPKTFELIIGGGGSMILAHGFPLATTDIDAIPKGFEISELDPFVKQVAQELDLAPYWLNPWFATFSHTLPQDYAKRLIDVFVGQKIRARALGANEMLIMKCFAHRQKDIGHAKALLRGGADIEWVRSHIETLNARKIPQAELALDFLDDITDQMS